MPVPFRFLPASPSETIVYGAERPGYDSEAVGPEAVADWLSHMREMDIQRVCCLLTADQLDYYAQDLLAAYKETFGEDNVCWAPVKDFHLVDKETLLMKILPFLHNSAEKNTRVVVHCSGGLGRTGHVLAAWLMSGKRMTAKESISTVKEMGRIPDEAVTAGKAKMDELLQLLNTVKNHRSY